MAALTRKTWATENPSTASTAASVGPRTRLPLMAAEFRLIAPGRSARSTSNGMLAWKAGALSALAMPVRATAPYSAHSGLLRGDERGERDGDDHLDDLHDDQEAHPVEAVGEQSADQREQQHRPELDEDQQPDEGGRFGAVVDVRGEREVLHPRADERQRHADEHDAEVAVRERGPDRAGRVTTIPTTVWSSDRGHVLTGWSSYRCGPPPT